MGVIRFLIGITVVALRLGAMFVQGLGVARDYVLAHRWFSLAAANGMDAAGKARDQLATQMTPDQIVEAQRLAREWKPTR